MGFYCFYYLLGNRCVSIFVLGFQVPDRVIDTPLVFDTDSVAGMHQDGDLPPCIDDGKSSVKDLETPVLEGKSSGIICFPFVFYTENGIDICICAEGGTKMDSSSGSTANLLLKSFRYSCSRKRLAS